MHPSIAHEQDQHESGVDDEPVTPRCDGLDGLAGTALVNWVRIAGMNGGIGGLLEFLSNIARFSNPGYAEDCERNSYGMEALQGGGKLIDEVGIERELAEDFRRQVQEADARKRQWGTYDHAAFIAWVEANTEALIQISLDNGTARDRDTATRAVAEYQSDVRQVPALGPYDEISTFMILQRLVGEIEAACSAIGVPTRSGVVFGTAPMLGVQAHQSSVQLTDASVIGVSPSFLPFCDLISKALVASLSIDPSKESISNDPELARRKLQSSPDLVLLWAKTLLHFAMYGLPPPKLDRKLDEYEGMARIEMLRAIELFAVGHEYGHHALRHGTAAPLGSTDRLAQELEADFFGQAMAKYIGSQGGHPNFYAISGAGGVSILSALRIVRQIRAVLTTGHEEPDTGGSHPPLSARVESILEIHVNEKDENREAFADMCDCFRRIFEIVWEDLKPLCLQMHAGGTRPHDDVLASGGWLPLNA